ncbi:MAG: alpha-E domain-containing protein [Hungatella sp.]|nr:alpha-E domain-containing protein [Hungatella sp.]
MGIISIEKADHLFWLGRYAERVLTTLTTFFDFYDEMIDGNEEAYKVFCEKIAIPDIYGSKENFQQSYLFDRQNPDSVVSNMERAFDNGVVIRGELGTYPLSYIQMALDSLKGEGGNAGAPVYDLQQVIDYLNAFWGCMDDQTEDEQCRNIMKCGKYVERLDLYMRLGYPAGAVEKEFSKLVNRLHKAGIPYRVDHEARLAQIIRMGEGWRDHENQALHALWNLFEVM